VLLHHDAEWVCRALTSFSSNEDAKVLIGKAGVAGPLVRLLQAPFITSSSCTVECACGTLIGISNGNAINARLLGNAGVAEPLVALLRADVDSLSAGAAMRLCEALACLAEVSPDLARNLVGQGAISAVGCVLRSRLAPLVNAAAEHALGALRQSSQ